LCRAADACAFAALATRATWRPSARGRRPPRLKGHHARHPELPRSGLRQGRADTWTRTNVQTHIAHVRPRVGGALPSCGASSRQRSRLSPKRCVHTHSECSPRGGPARRAFEVIILSNKVEALDVSLQRAERAVSPTSARGRPPIVGAALPDDGRGFVALRWSPGSTRQARSLGDSGTPLAGR
jgi:hypothetical protein